MCPGPNGRANEARQRTTTNALSAAEEAGITPHASLEVHGASEQGDDLLLTKAANELRRLKAEISLNEQQRQALLRVFLAYLFCVSMDGKRDPARHADRLRRTQIKKREDTPHHKQTVRAVLAEAGWAAKPSTEHEWSQALTALELSQVDEREDAIVRWLTEDAEVGGRAVRGFERAEAVVKTSTELKSAARQRASEREADNENTFASAVRRLEAAPLGTIEASTDQEVPTGTWLSLNEDAQVLGHVRVSAKRLRSIILKSGD